MPLTQNERLLTALRRGPVHSLVARRELFIGNPSQRIAELEDVGHVISHERMPWQGSTAIGTLYRLEREATHSGTVPTGEDGVPTGTRVPSPLSRETEPDPLPIEIPVGNNETVSASQEQQEDGDVPESFEDALAELRRTSERPSIFDPYSEAA